MSQLQIEGTRQLQWCKTLFYCDRPGVNPI
jgi:hypothetical protein